jgi:hypothetical protein
MKLLVAANVAWLVVFVLSVAFIPALIVPFGLVGLEGVWLVVMGYRLMSNHGNLSSRLADWATAHRRNPLALGWMTAGGNRIIGGILLLGGVGFCFAALAAMVAFRGWLL